MTAASVAARELALLLPGGAVHECALVKRGPRADTYHVTLGDGSRVLAKRFRALDGYARNECASYRLFAERHIPVAPAMCFVADDCRWILTEEVEGRDFTSALAAGETAAAMMHRLGRTLVALIAGTIDPCGDPTIREIESDNFVKRWPAVMRWSEGLGVACNRALEDAVARIVEQYRNPPLIAWTQGDPAPSNVLFTDKTALLVDFEYAGHRHALHDLVQWSVRIPLPYHWYARLEHVVGSGLIERGVYRDDASFHDDHATMAGYAALYMFTWLPIERALDEDAPWAPGFDLRSALLSTTNRLSARLRSTEPLISEWSERVFTVLSRRWPERRVGLVDWGVGADL